MTSPRILARAQHTVSRKNFDEDALKVLYRLKNHGYTAYLVGGGVRDLLLGRKPKDFDIGTSAHPQQVKKLFRNCFIIGRRFRLCHVRFGKKVIEVSTFRKLAEAEEGESLIRRDNTFGTPEEDAFRRDFTVNALFYDIATFSVIDYVGGLDDLDQGIIRTIGDPGVRFREDPVRMFRAVALAARLGFTIEGDTLEAIRALRGEIVKSSPPRLVDEFYKVLRQGAARRTFEMLHDLGLLAYLLPEAERAVKAGSDDLLASLQRLDDYRNAGHASPEQLTNPILMGTLFVPLGMPLRRGALPPRREAERAGEPADDLRAELQVLGEEPPQEAPGPPPSGPLVLPFARRDLDRVQLMLLAQRRLREVNRPSHVKQLLAGRGYFEEALRFMEIHCGEECRGLVSYWRNLYLGDQPPPAGLLAEAPAAEPAASRPRRRRRRRRRPSPPRA
jgi:tRNA nucleotidyltransferase/poly(A) polymerase